ncbi:MAG: hypothetical protein JW955_03300 [Sedimentisphaerales bacterium]|nr:hypothetical protein [Sedimentisphaerales bacterium]
MAIETITKLDAACRQLNTAISLWFADNDPVSIHTLTCSAHQIVHDINHQRGGRDLIYDSLIYKDEYRREVVRLLKRHYNFFKHADNDPSAVIEFDPKVTDFFMLFTSLGLEALGRAPDKVRGAFNIYHGLMYPKFLSKKGREKWVGALSQEVREHILNMSKYQFFVWYVHIAKLS